MWEVKTGERLHTLLGRKGQGVKVAFGPNGKVIASVAQDYRIQRLVYALACFRAGAEVAEVVYAFLERPDAVVSVTFTRAEVPELEAELSEAIARIQSGRFPPRPSEFACAGCPALDVVCAGPALRG